MLLLYINRVYNFYSMGGAIAVHIAAKQLISTLVALSVIDVVEGEFLSEYLLHFELQSQEIHLKSLLTINYT